MISSLKIVIKIVAKNFGGIGMCFWCCWKDLDEKDLLAVPAYRRDYTYWLV
jgi:hypothetical protein